MGALISNLTVKYNFLAYKLSIQLCLATICKCVRVSLGVLMQTQRYKHGKQKAQVEIGENYCRDQHLQ